MLFILVGPGGVGKNAMINTVINGVSGLRQLPTATTRPIRQSEQQGREHMFVTTDEFRQLIESDKLIEWQEVHKDRFYGVPRATVEQAIADEQDLIADIEVYGAAILKNNYADNVRLIFVAPPTLDELEKRMRDRGDAEEEIHKRLARVRIEMPYAPSCDYLIVNGDFDTAVDTLRAIILAERSKRALLRLRLALKTAETEE